MTQTQQWAASDVQILEAIEDLRAREARILATLVYEVTEQDIGDLTDVRSQLAILGESPR